MRGLTLCPLRVTVQGGVGSEGISPFPEPCSGTAGHRRPGEGALAHNTHNTKKTCSRGTVSGSVNFGVIKVVVVMKKMFCSIATLTY